MPFILCDPQVPSSEKLNFQFGVPSSGWFYRVSWLTPGVLRDRTNPPSFPQGLLTENMESEEEEGACPVLQYTMLCSAEPTLFDIAASSMQPIIEHSPFGSTTARLAIEY